MTNIVNKYIIGGSNTEIFTIKDYTKYQEKYGSSCNLLSDTDEEYRIYK